MTKRHGTGFTYNLNSLTTTQDFPFTNSHFTTETGTFFLKLRIWATVSLTFPSENPEEGVFEANNGQKL